MGCVQKCWNMWKFPKKRAMIERINKYELSSRYVAWTRSCNESFCKGKFSVTLPLHSENFDSFSTYIITLSKHPSMTTNRRKYKRYSLPTSIVRQSRRFGIVLSSISFSIRWYFPSFIYLCWRLISILIQAWNTN